MANINVMTRNKQMALLVALLLGLAGAGIVAWYIGSPSRAAPGKNQPAKPVPDMTGAVTSTTFGKKVSESAVADLQHTASEVDKKLNQFELQLKKITGENEVYQKTVQMQNDALKHLQMQMDSLRSENHGDTLKLRDDRAEPQLPVGTSLPTSVPPPTAFYPGPPMNQTMASERAQPPPELSTMTVGYSHNSDKHHSLPYIPSGSFAPATVIEGADANASVTGESASSPMQFRLTGKVILPNDGEYDLRGCFVTAAAYGDISSERALLRTDRLSCRIHNRIIDQKIKGHVSFMGKNGIRAMPVIRNGKIVGYAFAGGAIDAMGSAMSSVGSTTVGLGSSHSVTSGDVARAGLGGGTSQAGKTLSEYFIKRAEQYHPVIPVGAGVSVSVVFQEGFQLRYVDGEEAKSTRQTPAETSSDNGITITKEVLNELKLGDAVGTANPSPATWK